MSRDNLDLGVCGESAAVDFLKKQGYKILQRNYRTKLGEIDIIAVDKGTVCFIEVKTRRNVRFGLPQEALNRHKKRQIQKSALVYLKDRHLLDKKARFDVVAVLSGENQFKIELIKNAFILDESFTI